jgi:hypothetical protein
MLPGLRFIAATIVLSISILIFGFGAAALLRASHEEFANLKTVRPTQPQVFAQAIEREQPTITLMQVETVAEQPPPQDIGLTASENAKTAQDNAKIASIDPQGTAEAKTLVPDLTKKAQPEKRRVRRFVHRRRLIVQPSDSTVQPQVPTTRQQRAATPQQNAATGLLGLPNSN